MKKIHIRYLVPGLIEIDIPEKWDDMTLKEKDEYCSTILKNTPDRDMVFGTAELKGENINEMFDSTPLVEAIELFDEGDGVETVVATRAWHEFAYGGQSD